MPLSAERVAVAPTAHAENLSTPAKDPTLAGAVPNTSKSISAATIQMSADEKFLFVSADPADPAAHAAAPASRNERRFCLLKMGRCCRT